MLDSKKKAILATFVFFAVFFFTTATINHEKRKSAPSDDVIVADSPIVFYYGYNCPHCEIVEKYLDENDIASKVGFSKKEVYKNKANAAEAIEKAAQCGIGADKLGVPFLWDGESCHIGDRDIIDFFKRLISEAEKSDAEEAADGEQAAPQDAAAAVVEELPAKKIIPAAADGVLFYGANCPHCKTVEEYIETNRVGEKIAFARKEVSKAAENREDLIAKAAACGLKPERLSVPILYFEGRCYLGEDEIINFFKGKINE